MTPFDSIFFVGWLIHALVITWRPYTECYVFGWDSERCNYFPNRFGIVPTLLDMGSWFSRSTPCRRFNSPSFCRKLASIITCDLVSLSISMDPVERSWCDLFQALGLVDRYVAVICSRYPLSLTGNARLGALRFLPTLVSSVSSLMHVAISAQVTSVWFYVVAYILMRFTQLTCNCNFTLLSRVIGL